MLSSRRWQSTLEANTVWLCLATVKSTPGERARMANSDMETERKHSKLNYLTFKFGLGNKSFLTIQNTIV